IEIEIPAEESRWVVARCSLEPNNFNAITRNNIAHTSAIYVIVNGEPVLRADAAKSWKNLLEQHYENVEANANFANNEQREEALTYIASGIRKYEELLTKQAGEESRSSP
ncbi:MAG: hypothetical protein KC964_24645, partial [Candidatus Omnitrophica bacterium]|nr:hypothetical protein [Candidatus Omnitrophota bacterium]